MNQSAMAMKPPRLKLHDGRPIAGLRPEASAPASHATGGLARAVCDHVACQRQGCTHTSCGTQGCGETLAWLYFQRADLSVWTPDDADETPPWRRPGGLMTAYLPPGFHELEGHPNLWAKTPHAIRSRRGAPRAPTLLPGTDRRGLTVLTVQRDRRRLHVVTLPRQQQHAYQRQSTQEAMHADSRGRIPSRWVMLSPSKLPVVLRCPRCKYDTEITANLMLAERTEHPDNP